MIRLNRMTDYAVVLMAELARTAGVASVGALAQRTAIPQPTVAKLMKLLTQGSLASAHRGSAGGYGLSRAAEVISIVDIIEAIEGPQLLTACVDGAPEPCGLEKLCPMNGRWDRVNKIILQALANMSLANMADPGTLFGPLEGGLGPDGAPTPSFNP